MTANVDLRQLAVRRQETPAVGSAGPAPARPRPLAIRYLLPAGVLLGFVAVLGWAARDSWLPSRPVTVMPVLTTRSVVRQAGTPLFQAAGWIEPRPTPVLVPALTEGVVAKLLVVEGQEVKAGEPLAHLIEADARLALRAAEADLRLRRAEAASARATEQAARTNAGQPVQLQAAAAESAALLAHKETELATLPFQLRSAEARLKLARIDLERKKNAGGAIPEHLRDKAESDYETALVLVLELQARQPRLDREIEALTQRRDALRQRLTLKTEETRQLLEAGAQVEAAEARLQQAQVAVDTAQLRLERSVIRAPASGRVLALVARPGSRLMGLDPRGMHEASTVVSLYDPRLLQIRADVRLEDVPRVQVGQAVKIETPAAPGGPLEGEVLFPTSQADLQKNTLQVKVSLKDPPSTLRPDMLVQVTFLSAAGARAEPESAFLGLLIPRSLVEAAEGVSRVWLADQTSARARLRTVKLGEVAGDLVEVVEGLNPSDKLIVSGRDGLREGERIAVTGEDTTIGGSTPNTVGARPARLPQPVGNDQQHKH